MFQAHSEYKEVLSNLDLLKKNVVRDNAEINQILQEMKISLGSFTLEGLNELVQSKSAGIFTECAKNALYQMIRMPPSTASSVILKLVMSF